ncbi:response regulator transcription factor [Nocardioides bizhenqiangii]|uniref:Response regulator transcription factor n=1 Tax=Nocardioides bizhenqiangii TaxID=3095076 RepID=A0ABZ0ZW32_9ACTN|nr:MULTISPECIES: response regulator transcription factor [unclassified Nocardioides]MDZ5622521.1 response regulator transcription factor [Nocardioides sp. HM23]WQQ28320.1 response regulator transcription factor [Nocardioides sp. HM61]
MSRMPRVLIADDHRPVRAGVRMALEEGGCEVVAEADTAFRAVELARETLPDACLLDIAMPGGGLWALRTILEELPHTRCIMLTVSADHADVLEAFERGAVGYLLKDVASAEVPRAVLSALEGDTILDGQLTAAVVDKLREGSQGASMTNAEGRKVVFTPREWDVLDLLREGLTTREIALHLRVRPITVRRHISDAMAKLKVSSRDEGIELLRRQRTAPGRAHHRGS